MNEQGVKIIGYNHVVVSSDKIFPPLTEAQGVELLKKDLVKFEECVEKATPFVNDNQFAAVCYIDKLILLVLQSYLRYSWYP